jgi:dolichol-phosphate mannosyltransferase
MKGKGEESFPSTLVIVAALNEEEGIGPTLAEIKGCLDRPLCLVVDGRSVDGTAKIAEAMGAHVIFQKGSGKGDAIATALAHAQELNVKHVALTDADYTYPAEYLSRMISILEENPDVGMVCGNRFDKPFRLTGAGSSYYIGNRFLALMQHFVNGIRMRDPLTGLRVVRWGILKGWRPKSKGFDVEAELNYFVERKGYKIVEIPIHYRDRLGEKKLKMKHGFTILERILAESLLGFVGEQ